MREIIKQRFLDHLQVANAVMNSDILAQIERIAVEVKKALANNGNKVLFCGNGGRAPDSPLPASIWLLNLSAAFKRNVQVCLLSR